MNNISVYAKNTGMIILGGGLIKHHICNANLMVSSGFSKLRFKKMPKKCNFHVLLWCWGIFKLPFLKLNVIITHHNHNSIVTVVSWISTFCWDYSFYFSVFSFSFGFN